MRSWKVLLIAFAAAGALTLAGCGSNRDSGDDTSATTTEDLGTNAEGVAFVGSDTCIGCHVDFSWSDEIVSGYLDGAHVIHSDSINAAESDYCLGCHDPIGDSAGIEPLIAAEDVPADGLAAVGCEKCHGAGGEHYGVGPIPKASPDAETCGQCHDELPEGHLTYHPEANFIYNDYAASPHADADGRNEVVCVKCHNDEGARKYKDVTTFEGLQATLPIEGEVHAIQCRTCHDPHNAGQLLKPAQDSGYPDHILVESTEYATCTNCHQDADAQLVSFTYEEGDTRGTTGDLKTYKDWKEDMLDLSGSDDGPKGDLIYHAYRYERVISSTHYDNPLTDYNSSHDAAGDPLLETDPAYAPSKIEGYVVKAADDHGCRDCHNVHASDNEINKQWARSGHGGTILDVKEDVEPPLDADDDPLYELDHSIEGAVDIRLAGVTDEESPAWNHYDWDAGDRQSCQMCHTATGAMNFLDDQANYDPANNDFSHLEGWSVDEEGTVTSSGQNEMLYCWGCHSNNSGDLRNPGGVTLAYTVDGVEPTLPDVGKSNVCVNCHGGRGNMDSYELAGDPATDMSTLAPGFGPGTKNVTSSHYLTAAATLFQDQTRVGYEYAGQDYANVSYFEHDIVGLNADDPESGAGPCAGCHMETAESHTWEIVEKDASGVITGLNSTRCVECHTGGHGPGLVVEDTTTENGLQTAADAAAFLEAEAEGYHEALAIMEAELAADGLTFSTDYPYFSGTSWIDEGTFGAAHNYNYLHHEPGAYAHNRYYAKRLIFDSIDWLDNGTLDGTIAVDETTYPEAAHWFGWDGTTARFVAERP